MNHPLDSIIFIQLPEDALYEDTGFHLDPSIMLPVQKPNANEDFNPKALSWDGILAGILTLLAYDADNEHIAYYKSLLLHTRPNIKLELTEAAILKIKNEDYDIAEEIFLSLRGLDSEDPITILNSALFYEQRAESYRNSSLHDDANAYEEKAHSYYKKALHAEPPIADAFFNAAFFYLKQKNASQAKDYFETYIALCQGEEFEQDETMQNKIEKAQEIINDINSKNLDDELFKSAYDFIRLGQEEKGLEAIKQFLEKNPKVWNAWFLLGWALRRLERFSEAKEAFLQCIALDGINVDVYNECAICYMEEGSYAESKNMLYKALQLEGENTKIMSNLGFLALREGNVEEARSFFLAVLEFDPDDALVLATLEGLE
ncbi:MAG TPA: tetratricopeptide repeat protein [Treponemataceae bacterium]|nr:tetratricopeptide repeat protein [Treponemataceae bacterium]